MASIPWEGEIDDYYLAKAVKDIYADYGDKVTVEGKAKNLLKFGKNSLVGTSEATIAHQPAGILHETYVGTNAITHVSSSSASDTGEWVLEGHYFDGDGNKVFKVQSVTLTGQTKAALGTALCRCTRAYNNGSSNGVGNIYAFEDDTLVAGVPQTDTKVHLIVVAGENQSEKASTSVSYRDYWIVTQVHFATTKKTNVDCEGHLQVRLNGKTFRQKMHGGFSTSHNFTVDLKPYLVVPKNADVRLTASSTATSTPVVGFINGVLASIIET